MSAGRRRPWLWLSLALLAVASLSVGALACWTWRNAMEPYQGYEGSEKLVEVPAGATARSILESLEDEGVLRDARLTRLYLTRVLEDPHLKAGEYRFEGARSMPEVLDRLIRGEVVTYPVTVVEGWTIRETARRLADKGFGEFEKLLEEMSQPRLIADLDPEARDLEGYLFPDTYNFARGTAESQIVATLVVTFRQRWREVIEPILEERLGFVEHQSGDPGLSVRELVTLASLVETEARLDEERPVIAGVYANRVERGMLMQADPTVIYALEELDRWDGNLRRADLKVDHPYNTYRYPGLPPGPIASPGLASLTAAARPAEVPYLYFVSRNDGSHVFARTLTEHNRNVHEWQKVYWRKRWAEERRRAAADKEADSS